MLFTIVNPKYPNSFRRLATHLLNTTHENHLAVLHRPLSKDTSWNDICAKNQYWLCRARENFESPRAMFIPSITIPGRPAPVHFINVSLFKIINHTLEEQIEHLSIHLCGMFYYFNETFSVEIREIPYAPNWERLADDNIG